jgi:hypothetical protein
MDARRRFEGAVGAMRRVWQRHRRLILILLAVSLFFSALGYFVAPVAVPGMCMVYG